jgi:soluble cytochrome b562
MRFLLAFLALIPMQAMSLKDFNARPSADRSAYVADFIDKMTTDLRAKNPELAQSIRTWFAVKSEGKTSSEGMERLNVELGAVEIQAQQGKADLSKVQLESVIVWVVKQKFPPPSK